MKYLAEQKFFKIFTNLKFAIFILFIIAASSSLGSFIEQDEPISFYKKNYLSTKPIYGFIDSNIILGLGIDHVYRTWWFLTLLVILGFCLISCTITRQFPLFLTSKDFFFKKEKKSFLNLPFFVKIKNIYYLKEAILLKIQSFNFYIYQNKSFLYAYKGLVGRISPILVHFSLLIILIGSSIGAFQNFQAQEFLPKGELFHIQNPVQSGWFTFFPNTSARVNDFWVEYEKKKIHQFYSSLSILDNNAKELRQQTISVNNPLRYKNIDFYQSDWNLLGIRVKNIKEKKIQEFPLFLLNKNPKSWVTWIWVEIAPEKKKNYTIVFDELKNTFLVYNEQGKFFGNGIDMGVPVFLSSHSTDYSFLKEEEDKSSFFILDIIPSTGLLIKYDVSIWIIYLGFGILMLTACLSYLPYTQFWIFFQEKNSWIGGSTNRGKIQLEIEFENLIRFIEKNMNPYAV
jgi:cytochrome c biogenesis protein